MTPRRIKLALILVSGALAALVLAAWTQTWVTVTPSDTAAIVADGSVAAPALTALALSELVLLGAIALAGPFFRVVLGVIQALVGATIAYSSLLALLDPVNSAASAITKATGITGAESLAGYGDDEVLVSAWPAVALGAGVGLVVLAILILVTARRWPGSTRKYQAVRFDTAERTEGAPAERDSVTDWDALTHGDDPTK
jgi:hypothetical protein